jgi:hypothetical protein
MRRPGGREGGRAWGRWAVKYEEGREQKLRRGKEELMEKGLKIRLKDVCFKGCKTGRDGGREGWREGGGEGGRGGGRACRRVT